MRGRFFGLLQSAEFVGVQVARELGLAAPRPGPAGEKPADAAPGADADGTEVPPRIVADRDDRPTTPQAPAVPPSASLPGGSPRAGWPVVDHGGAGEHTPTRPRSRRAPPDDPSAPDPDSALLLTGGAPCPA
ncbi:MAG: hypothetical protein ACRDUV_14025 [Pseudonocardiaceae bacterium]